MNKGLVTVFGGSGFLGKYVVRALVKEDGVYVSLFVVHIQLKI
jgi:uncharacterized protein YbjT (DUF2867 family)